MPGIRLALTSNRQSDSLTARYRTLIHNLLAPLISTRTVYTVGYAGNNTYIIFEIQKMFADAFYSMSDIGKLDIGKLEHGQIMVCQFC